MVSRRRWRREACDIGQTPVQNRNRSLTGAGERIFLSVLPQAGLSGAEPEHDGSPDRGGKHGNTLHLPQYGAESRVHPPRVMRCIASVHAGALDLSLRVGGLIENNFLRLCFATPSPQPLAAPDGWSFGKINEGRS